LWLVFRSTPRIAYPDFLIVIVIFRFYSHVRWRMGMGIQAWVSVSMAHAAGGAGREAEGRVISYAMIVYISPRRRVRCKGLVYHCVCAASLFHRLSFTSSDFHPTSQRIQGGTMLALTSFCTLAATSGFCMRVARAALAAWGFLFIPSVAR